MKPLSKLLTAVTLVFACLASAQAQALANPQSANQFIQNLSDELVRAVTDNPTIAKNSKELEQLVNNKVVPAVDFEKMTQSSVGRSWRVATAEQKKALSNEFKSLLIRTYATAASKIDNSVKITVKPSRGESAEEPVVRTSVTSRLQPEPLEIHYRLRPEGPGYKVVDINVAGLWMTSTYRTQFAPIAESEGLDELLKKMKALNGR